MPGFLQIRTGSTATAGVSFECTVAVVNAHPGDVITVRLAQLQGGHPRFTDRADIPVALDGGGLHVFDVTLHGAGTEALLVADDIVSGFPVASASAHVAVVP